MSAELEYSESIRMVIDTMAALRPDGFTIEDLEQAAPDVPVPNLAATVASMAARGRLLPLGWETARKRSSKSRKVQVYMVP
ncbi:MAG: hypothetical protein ACREB9_07455 [Thermoplasmata archaeon]